MNGKGGVRRRVREGMVFAYGSVVDWDGVIFPDASIGNGTNAQFWVEWWCGDGILKDVFRNCLVLHRIRRLLWRTICVAMMSPCIGT